MEALPRRGEEDRKTERGGVRRERERERERQRDGKRWRQRETDVER